MLRSRFVSPTTNVTTGIASAGTDVSITKSSSSSTSTSISKNWKQTERRQQQRWQRWSSNNWYGTSVRRRPILPFLLFVLSSFFVLLVLVAFHFTFRGDTNESINGNKKNMSTNKKNENGTPCWHELDITNFASVIGSSSFTLVLFYDRDDHTNTTVGEHAVLEKLAFEQQEINHFEDDDKNIVEEQQQQQVAVLSFAKLDIRRHAQIREAYDFTDRNDRDYEEFYLEYKKFYAADLPVTPAEAEVGENNNNNNKTILFPLPSGMINSSTFMTKQRGNILPTFPSQWILFNGDTYNAYNFNKNKADTDADANDYYSRSTLDFDRKFTLVKHFLEIVTAEGYDDDDGNGNDHGNDDISMIKALIYDEKDLKEDHAQWDAMGSINWEATRRLATAQQQNNNIQNDTSIDSLDLFRIEQDEAGDTFYKYKTVATPESNNTNKYSNKKKEEEPPMDDDNVNDVLDSFATLIEIYLNWNDSYENLWDKERKVREDKMTNYGWYLTIMNNKFKNVVFSFFNNNNEDEDNEHYTPNLKRYFEDIIFGYGRSPTALNQHLEDVVYKAAAAAGDDNNDNNDDNVNAKDLELFERLREYMRVREEIYSTPGILRWEYHKFFKILYTQLLNIMAEFHTSLSIHYTTYLEQHPKVARQNHWNFATLDIIDITDPNNYNLMSDYDEFERRYTAQRRPVVLSQLWLEKPYNYTLKYLLEKCGFVDVAGYVKTSFRLGGGDKGTKTDEDEVIDDWGGLRDFEIPKELKVRYEDEDFDEDSEEENEISLEIFIGLTKYLDNLYLHDFSLDGSCSSLLSSKSPYDSSNNQYFKMPSVIARYDLTQKIPYSGIATSWPSLFIGRKGTNSKLHIDAQSSGFWMYLISGRKRWIIFDVAERPLLYMRHDEPSFLADVLALDTTNSSRSSIIKRRRKIEKYFDATYPLLGRATSESRGYEIIQEPGQLVYIPPGAPHAVENLDDTVGIALNLVPRTGVACHLHNLIHIQRDFGRLEIKLRYLMSAERRQSSSSSLAESVDPLYTTLGEYRSQG